jgi:hypothetical protein
MIAPLPSIVISVVTDGNPFSPVVTLSMSGTVKVLAAGRMIVSPPLPAAQSACVAASSLALTIASRSEQSPSAAITTTPAATVMFAACAGGLVDSATASRAAGVASASRRPHSRRWFRVSPPSQRRSPSSRARSPSRRAMTTLASQGLSAAAVSSARQAARSSGSGFDTGSGTGAGDSVGCCMAMSPKLRAEVATRRHATQGAGDAAQSPGARSRVNAVLWRLIH